VPVSSKRKLTKKKIKSLRSRNKVRGMSPGSDARRAPPTRERGIVEALLRESGRRRADPRDWVAFIGASFLDGDGDVKVSLPQPPILGVADKTVLVRKDRLAEWVGEKLARFFWDGARVPRVRREKMMAAEVASRSKP